MANDCDEDVWISTCDRYFLFNTSWKTKLVKASSCLTKATSYVLLWEAS